MCIAQQKIKFAFKRGDAQLLIFCWFFSLLLKVDDATFETNMANHSQVITFSMLPKIFLVNQQ